jgi:hypothetical protein
LAIVGLASGSVSADDQAGEPLVLVDAGHSPYAIVVGSDAAVPVRTAGAELQKYVQAISGRHCPSSLRPCSPR